MNTRSIIQSLSLLSAALLLFGCLHRSTNAVGDGTSSNAGIFAKLPNADSVGSFHIEDTTIFIAWLKQFLDPYFLEIVRPEEEITFFKQVKINGSMSDYYLVEYDYKSGCGAEFPYKFQLLFTDEGKLLKRLNGQRFEFVTIFPGENPFMLVLSATSKGNGWHDLYRIVSDSLVNVYEGSCDFGDGTHGLRTYDEHEDGKIYDPRELKFVTHDFDGDGYNDIAFEGDAVTEDGLEKLFHMQMIILYNPKTGRFEPKEDYNEKYKIYE